MSTCPSVSPPFPAPFARGQGNLQAQSKVHCGMSAQPRLLRGHKSPNQSGHSTSFSPKIGAITRLLWFAEGSSGTPALYCDDLPQVNHPSVARWVPPRLDQYALA